MLSHPEDLTLHSQYTSYRVKTNKYNKQNTYHEKLELCPHFSTSKLKFFWMDGWMDKGKSKCPLLQWGHKNGLKSNHLIHSDDRSLYLKSFSVLMSPW